MDESNAKSEASNRIKQNCVRGWGNSGATPESSNDSPNLTKALIKTVPDKARA